MLTSEDIDQQSKKKREQINHCEKTVDELISKHYKDGIAHIKIDDRVDKIFTSEEWISYLKPLYEKHWIIYTLKDNLEVFMCFQKRKESE